MNIKNVILDTAGGMGNRLCPLISLIKLSKQYNFNLYVKWNKDEFKTKIGTISFSINLNDLFNNNFNIIKDTNNFKNIKYINNKKNPINFKEIFNKYDTIIINCVYLIDDNTVNLSKWIPYTKIKTTYIQDPFIIELKKYAKQLVLNKNINEKVNNYLQLFTSNMLGVHIRGSDNSLTSFYRSDNPSPNNDLDIFSNICNNFIKENDSKILLITPHSYIKEYMEKKYPKHILIVPGERNYTRDRSTLEGISFALIELFLYSKCNRIIGTAGSAFSFLGWLLSDCSEYQTLF